MHDGPGDVRMACGVGARGAVGHLATTSGAALDRQECLGNIAPASVPLDAAALNRVLRFEHQGVFGFKAVVD